MKNIHLTFIFLTLLTASIYAQVPQKLSWQGIVRNDAGSPITAAVELRFSILEGTTPVFSEQTTITPNSFGLVVWNIGETETTSFEAINWAGGVKTLKVEMRTTVGSGNFTDVGTEELKSVPYALVAGKALSDNDNQNLALNGDTLSITGGNGVTLPPNTDAQTLAVNGQNLSISGGNFVVLPTDGDGSSTNEIQTMSLSGETLSLSNGGGSVILPTDGDGSSTNEIQTISLSGETLSLSNGGGSVTLQSNAVPQTLEVNGQNLSISGGNTVVLPTDGDGSATNEIQTVSLSGQTLSLSNGGGSVTLPPGTTYSAGSGIAISAGDVISNTGDGDSNPANEIQALTLSGQILSLSNGGGSVTFPPEAQTLAVNGQNLSISGGNTIPLPFDGDSSAINEIQKITLVKDSLRLSKSGGLVILKDTSSTNEIQTMTLTGGTLSLSKGGGSVTLPTYQPGSGIYFTGNTINAVDDSPGNELQEISIAGNALSLSQGGGTVVLPNYWDESGGSIHNNNSGNVGIGTSAPTAKLDVAGPMNLNNGLTGIAMYANGSEAMWYDGYYSWGFGGTSNYFADVTEIGMNECCWWLEVVGDVAKPGGGSWSALSDKRYKQNVQPYTDGLSSVLKINPVRYHYNEKSGYDTNPEYVGVIAQELRETAPYMIKEMPTGKLNGTENFVSVKSNNAPSREASDDTYLSIDNSAMTYMLINAVKEQQAEIAQLKTQVQQLQLQVDQFPRKKKGKRPEASRQGEVQGEALK